MTFNTNDALEAEVDGLQRKALTSTGQKISLGT
jgi:hypothetical protein